MARRTNSHGFVLPKLNLRVANGKTFASGTCLDAKRVVVRYRWLPLVTGRLKPIQTVQSVRLFSPKIWIERYASGKLNVQDLFARVEARFGGIGYLVNNAGVARDALLAFLTDKQWDEVLDTNLTGLFLVTQQVVQGMIARKSGKIINICSLMCEASRPTVGAYTAAKGGVKQLTKSMAVEWAKHNIQSNGIGPGYILTEMNRPLIEDQKFDAWVRARTPAGRWADPTELVGTAVFLASRASDFVNGQIIYVDGGILAAL